MSRVHEYFMKEFPSVVSLDKSMTGVDRISGQLGLISIRIHVNFPANARFVSLYFADAANAAALARHLFPQVGRLLEQKNITNIQLPRVDTAGVEVSVQTGEPGSGSALISYSQGDGEPTEAGAVPFTGRVFIYTDIELEDATKNQLSIEARGTNLSVRFRGPAFAKAADEFQIPQAFISHDSRDNAIALKIAIGLQQRWCPVWYDEFSMVVGKSIRESVESGIKQCGFCILLLTPNFLANGGWPKREYTMAFTKELVADRDVILPVWHGVTRDEVFEYSPLLADKCGVQWSLGEDEVCRRLYRAIDQKPDEKIAPTRRASDEQQSQ